ncbi:glycosyltransferase [bacterium]|nr:glycosyltransferase [bacterium]
MNSQRYLPKISVIIPTLNAERTLDRCLEALRAQDYPRELVEIVIADGGSTDRTLDIAGQYGVDRIVPNPLKTGEAGKAAAIEASTGDLLALVDSDNTLDDTGYFSRAARVLENPSVAAAEPIEWTFDSGDTLVNRYCALIGVNDPICYFLGNYNRYSHLSRKFTGMRLETTTDTPDAIIADISPDAVPTFGANGFIVRRTALDGLDWKPYYFDIDVFQQMVRSGHNRIGVMKTGIRHLYCDRVATFGRKQARRIGDYLHHKKRKSRTYDYRAVPARRYIIFVLYTITVLPLMVQSVRGYLHKPDSAWWFHPIACWITLWEYGWGTVRSFLGVGEYDRTTWKQ